MEQIGSRFWATADKDSLDLTDYWKHKFSDPQGAGHSLHTFSKLSLNTGEKSEDGESRALRGGIQQLYLYWLKTA